MGKMIKQSIFFGITLCSLMAKLAAEDRVDLRDGKSVAGRIQQETATQVVIQNTTGTQTVPVNQINQIHYDGQPATLTLAKTLEDSSKLNQAADEYAKAQLELKNRPLILEAAQFGEARARARMALDDGMGLDETIARLERLEREHGESRHHFMAQEFLGRLYIEKKDYEKAAQAFHALSGAPWRDAQLRAVVYHARMLRAQDKFDEAIRQLDETLQARPDSREGELAYCEVLLEKAQSLRALKRRAEQAEVLEQLIDRAPASATAMHAEAYTALGDAYRAADKNWNALWAFLHVQLLFGKHEDLHARALYNLSQLWTELGRPEKAAEAVSILKTEHPKSSWTKKLGP